MSSQTHVYENRFTCTFREVVYEKWTIVTFKRLHFIIISSILFFSFFHPPRVTSNTRIGCVRTYLHSGRRVGQRSHYRTCDRVFAFLVHTVTNGRDVHRVAVCVFAIFRENDIPRVIGSSEKIFFFNSQLLIGFYSFPMSVHYTGEIMFFRNFPHWKRCDFPRAVEIT